MQIAIVGAGNVGGALGVAWSRRGHDIVFGVTDPKAAKHRALLTAAPGSRIDGVAGAVARAEVMVLATPWAAAKPAVDAAGRLAGKILIDCTNPLTPDFRDLEIGHTISGAELIAGWATGARVVKAFNQTGANNMADPLYPGGRPVMFAAGDDMPAKTEVLRLAEEVGFEAVDAGPLAAARQLEQLAMLWIKLAMAEGHGRDIAFALMRR